MASPSRRIGPRSRPLKWRRYKIDEFKGDENFFKDEIFAGLLPSLDALLRRRRSPGLAGITFPLSFPITVGVFGAFFQLFPCFWLCHGLSLSVVAG
jgi:hypothetical protein